MRNVILLFLLIVGWTTTVCAQNEQETIEVTGIVTDPKNEPLIGVNVTARNMPGFGAITDINGRYKIKVPNYSYLIFSYVGFTKQEIFIKDKKIINIVMAETKETVIDEVVVTGTGAQKKVTVTGAVTTVDVSQLRTPTASITNALAGNVAGILARQTSGQPGSNISEFWIRGISTFGAGGSALVLVDGFERDMNEINVEDIQDFSVLKDASATAIYGSRGANGVVLITTKRGKEGKTRVNAKVETSYNTRTRTPEFVDGPTYARMMNEALVSRSQAPAYSESDLELFANGLDQDLFPNVDWMNLILKDGAPTYRATVDLTGGGTVARYFISASYVNEGGMYETDRAMTDYNTNANYHRWNYRMNVDIDLTKSTLRKVGVSGSLDKQNLPGSQYHEIWHSLMGYSPIASPVQYSDGKWAAVGSEGRRNPWVLTTQQGYQETWKNKIQTTVNLEQDLKFITKGLKFYGRFGFDTYTDNGDNRFKWPESWLAERQRTSDGELQFRRIETQKLMDGTMYSSGQRKEYLEAELHYNRTFGDHMLGAVLKYSQDKTTNTSHNGNTDSYEKIVQSIQNRHQGFAGRFTYGWKYRYFFDFNFGYNGSENFAPKKRYGFFPAGSVGWIVSEENFMKNQQTVDFLKLRASFGLVGNDKYSGARFLYLDGSWTGNHAVWQNGYGSYQFGMGGSMTMLPDAVENTVGNSEVTWEKVRKQNYGIDLKMFGARLSLTADYFFEHRYDILSTRNTLPSIVAIELPLINLGEVDNRGYEISLGWNSRTEKIDWWVQGNVSYSKNKIIFMDEVMPNYPWMAQTGRSTGLNYGYRFDRFLQADDFDADGALKTDGEGKPLLPVMSLGSPRPGDALFKDLNGDGKIDGNDKTYFGYSQRPDYVLGLLGGFRYKNFEISMQWTAGLHASRMLSGEYRNAFGSTNGRALLKFLADGRWTPENPDARFPRLTFLNKSHYLEDSDLWLMDGSYLRLKVAEIGYTFRDIPAFRKVGVKSLKVYFSGYNLLTLFSDLNDIDIDPEGATSGSNIDSYPNVRIFNFGVNITF